MLMDEFDIIIIGCGAVAVSFLYQLEKECLSRSSRKPLRVCVLDHTSDRGTGYAYATKNPELLLNTYVGEMGLSTTEPNSFQQWLDQNGYAGHFKNQFVPRHIFADYLEAVLNQLTNSAHIKIDFFNQEVLDCVDETNQIKIITNHEVFYAKSVIFSHGSALRPVFKEIKHLPNFINDPYYSTAPSIQNLEEGSAILVLGSSLTMVDACIALKQTGRKFEITIASESGYFPALKQASINHTFSKGIFDSFIHYWQDPQNHHVEGFLAFLNAALSQYFQTDISLKALEKAYNAEIEHPTFANPFNFSDPYDLSPIAPCIADLIKMIWFDLPPHGLKALAPTLKYLLRFICGIPEANILKLQSLFPGDFQIKQVHSLSETQGKFNGKFKPNIEESYYFDYVLNCTGMTGYYHCENPSYLSKNIIKRGQFSINPSSGLWVNERAQVMCSGNQKKYYPNAYALGETSLGSSFIRSHLWYYVEQARKAVESIMEII